jgi:hypothetical protein
VSYLGIDRSVSVKWSRSPSLCRKGWNEMEEEGERWTSCTIHRGLQSTFIYVPRFLSFSTFVF